MLGHQSFSGVGSFLTTCQGRVNRYFGNIYRTGSRVELNYPGTPKRKVEGSNLCRLLYRPRVSNPALLPLSQPSVNTEVPVTGTYVQGKPLLVGSSSLGVRREGWSRTTPEEGYESSPHSYALHVGCGSRF